MRAIESGRRLLLRRMPRSHYAALFPQTSPRLPSETFDLPETSGAPAVRADVAERDSTSFRLQTSRSETGYELRGYARSQRSRASPASTCSGTKSKADQIVRSPIVTAMHPGALGQPCSQSYDRTTSLLCSTFRPKLRLLKQLVSPFALTVAGIFHFDPSSGAVVSALPVFPDDALKVLLADHLN